jgi:glutamate synthase domain-containing protein 2
MDLRKDIKVIASGKIISAENVIKMRALGADICNSARGFMFSIGCIQALRCNTNACPAGVATQDETLQKGLVVSDKSERVYNFHQNTLRATMELLAACGLSSIQEISIDMYLKGDEFIDIQNKYYPNRMTEEILN